MRCLGLATVVLVAAGAAWADEAGQVFDVPRIEGIELDGKGGDWGEKGLRIEAMSWPDGPVCPVEDLDGRFRLAWDDRGLLILLHVTDSVPFEADEAGRLWQADCIELFQAEKVGGAERIQVLIAPGRTANHPDVRTHIFDRRASEELKKQPATVSAVRTKTESGYLMEALLPWSNLGIKPALGTEAAFQIYVNDGDTPGQRDRMIWFPLDEAHADSTRMHTVRLAKEPSPAVLAAATGRYEHFRRVAVTVVGPAKLAGKTVILRDGEAELARGKAELEAGRAEADLTAPMPPRGKPYGPLGVTLDGERIATLALPDPDVERARLWLETRPAFEPCIFHGQVFPPCRFSRPLLVEELIGPYRIETSFYDANCDPVTAAENPGRYGAVVTVHGEDGRSYTRYHTLFRTPEQFSWWREDFGGTLELPKAFGISGAAVAAQKEVVSDYVRWVFMDHARRFDAAAAVVAGLYETGEHKGKPVPFILEYEPRNRQYWVTLKRKLNGNAERFPGGFACPRLTPGGQAPILHPGSCEKAGFLAGTDKKLDELLTRWSKDTDEAFIACVARRGVIVLHKAYGERDGKPMTVHTPSWMASITKLIQGTCLMMLVDQNLVGLDDRVSAYLPAFKGVKTNNPLTIRHLICHCAGMWGHWGDDESDFEQRVAELAPHLEVGVKHQYNGMSLALAGKVIEQVSGESLPHFYYNHLFSPLGCHFTRAATGSWDAESTAMDMARIGQMLLNGGAYGRTRFFSEATRDKMLPRKLTMLLGPDTETVWGIGCTWMSTDVLSERTFGHGSAASATLRIDLENDLVVSMTRNRAGKNFGKYHPAFLKLIADSVAK